MGKIEPEVSFFKFFFSGAKGEGRGGGGGAIKF